MLIAVLPAARGPVDCSPGVRVDGFTASQLVFEVCCSPRSAQVVSSVISCFSCLEWATNSKIKSEDTEPRRRKKHRRVPNTIAMSEEEIKPLASSCILLLKEL